MLTERKIPMCKLTVNDREIDRMPVRLPLGMVVVKYHDNDTVGIVRQTDLKIQPCKRGKQLVKDLFPEDADPNKTVTVTGMEGNIVDMGPNEGMYRVRFSAVMYMTPEDY